MQPGALAGLSIESWDRVFAVNARATWLLARETHPMLAQNRGAIVAIASMSGMFPHQNYDAYSASKAALIMTCRQLAQEWAQDAIRINCISPGMVMTPLTKAVYQNPEVASRRRSIIPVGRIAMHEGSANAVVTGENLKVDSGFCDSILGTIPGVSSS